MKKKDKSVKEVRFFWEEKEGIRVTNNGDLAMWNVVYHLGNVVELHRK